MALISVIHSLFVFYTALIFLRILSSWLPPHLQRHRITLFIAFYTDPYLNIFRRLLPPLGGVLDLSPILAFFGLRIAEVFLVYLIQKIFVN
jgi:YggT family protein